MKAISEHLGREFVWLDQDGIGITIYLNQLVRRAAKFLGKEKFWAFFVTDDVKISPDVSNYLATEILIAEEKGWDFLLPVPIRRERQTNITDIDGRPKTLEEVRSMKKYAKYGVDYLGGASIAAYYGQFDARYTFHEDDINDESFYFINDQKKDVRLIPDIRVGHYKKIFLE